MIDSPEDEENLGFLFENSNQPESEEEKLNYSSGLKGTLSLNSPSVVCKRLFHYFFVCAK